MQGQEEQTLEKDEEEQFLLERLRLAKEMFSEYDHENLNKDEFK
jgi:hypothetical protein